MEVRQDLNFDHPDAIDFELLVQQLKELKEGKKIEPPVYSYITCSRSTTETVKVSPAPVIIVEGILIFTCKELRKLMDIMVYVDADDDDRLMRVISRDIMERGKSVEKVMERYQKTVKPMHLQFIAPSKRYADIIIPQGGHNSSHQHTYRNNRASTRKQRLMEEKHNKNNKRTGQRVGLYLTLISTFRCL